MLVLDLLKVATYNRQDTPALQLRPDIADWIAENDPRCKFDWFINGRSLEDGTAKAGLTFRKPESELLFKLTFG